jgi:hypothetical protein
MSSSCEMNGSIVGNADLLLYYVQEMTVLCVNKQQYLFKVSADKCINGDPSLGLFDSRYIDRVVPIANRINALSNSQGMLGMHYNCILTVSDFCRSLVRIQAIAC